MRFLPRKQLKKRLLKRDIAISYISYIRFDSVEIMQQDALEQPRETSFEVGPDELYMDCHGTLAFKISCRELDGTVWKQCINATNGVCLQMLKKSYRSRNLKNCFSFIWGITQRSPHLVIISSDSVVSSVGLPNARKHLKPPGYSWLSGSNVVVRLEIKESTRSRF